MSRRKRVRNGKPRVPAAGAVWLARAYEVFEASRYYSNGNTLAYQVVSDVWDGWATRDEIRPLVRRGWVFEERLPRECLPSVSPVTWGLTQWGLFWFRRWARAT